MTLQAEFGQCVLVGPERPGRRRYGVPPGGAFCSTSAAVANALLGLEAASPVYELACAQVSAKATRLTTLAVVGQGHDLAVDGRPVETNSRFAVEPGATVTMVPSQQGFRCWIALCESALPPARLARSEPGPARLRVMSGGRLHGVSAEVRPELDRVGIRLDSTLVPTADGLQQSVPAVFGGIQLTAAGQLLVHGPDGPTLGGYELLGCVASVDRPLLAQLRPGTRVEFEEVDRSEAVRLLKAAQAAAQAQIANLRALLP